jgi:cyclopropane-fatty-acyl-phospholipid synthase
VPASVDVASRVQPVLRYLLGSELPLRIRAWDGSEIGKDGPLVVLRDPRALRRLVWSPNEVGLARAFVAGELDIDGDLFTGLRAIRRLVEAAGTAIRSDLRGKLGMVRVAAGLGAVGLPPPPPAEEVRRLRGRRHSQTRDAAAISHHYDVGNAFYRHVLGPSMVYSCAYWSDEARTLEEAQRDKCELVCRKLGLRPGLRLLDVGCGWGSLVLHAAREYGVHAVGITLSQEQAALARERAAAAGLEDLIEIRVQDYRDVRAVTRDEPYDAIASIGMAEHVGKERYGAYAAELYQLLKPGGRLLNHQITRRPGPVIPRERTFIQAYVFPDGELLPIGEVVAQLERTGFEVRDDESLREHYGRTLRGWVANLDANWDDCVRLTSPGRVRVWKLYMTGSAMSFDAGSISIHQVLAVRPDTEGRSGLPATRTGWLSAG